MTSQGIEPWTTRNCTRSSNHRATRPLWELIHVGHLTNTCDPPTCHLTILFATLLAHTVGSGAIFRVVGMVVAVVAFGFMVLAVFVG